MNNTPNINLSTYTSDPNDKFNLLVTFNNNMTKIDTAVGAQNDAIDVIEETAGTAVTTANTASATAEEALTTAEGKTSINDNVASASTTYSSNKINDLIEGIEPGTEIDDSVTSTTKTWSSSKINTEVSAKASINDTTAGSTTTYSSNKIDTLTGLNIKFPDYNNGTSYSTTTTEGTKRILSYTATADCLVSGYIFQSSISNNPYLSLRIIRGTSGGEVFAETLREFTGIPPIFVEANTEVRVVVNDSTTADITLKIFPL